MKKASMNGAESTDFKPFDSKGSTKNIPASTAMGTTPSTTGAKATFSGGKKTVSK
jgi:hypothetical protein